MTWGLGWIVDMWLKEGLDAFTFVGHVTNVIAKMVALRIRRPYGPNPPRVATSAWNPEDPMHAEKKETFPSVISHGGFNTMWLCLL